MNKWKIGVYKTNHNKGNCNFLCLVRKGLDGPTIPLWKNHNI